MVTTDEFIHRVLRNIKRRRTILLRNITVKGGHSDPQTRGIADCEGITIPYTCEELALLHSIEADLEALLKLFEQRAEEQELTTEDGSWTAGT